MSVCEENSCENFQLAICLHCMHRLCVKHIVEHQNIVSIKKYDLKNQIDQINVDIINASKVVAEKSQSDLRKCVIWRRKKIAEIDREYAKMVDPIRNQEKKLEQLQQRVTIRLKTEVEQPLENISTEENINSELFDKIQLTIEAIQNDIKLLIWNSLQSDNNDIPDRRNEPRKVRPWKPRNLFYSLFRDIGPNSVNKIHDFVQTTMEDEDKMENNGLITLVFSYLQTWHQIKTEKVKYKQSMLNKHIFTVKQYIHGKDCQRKVLIAFEFFFDKFKEKGSTEIEIMTMLLELFFNHQCISISEIIDWYSNENSIKKKWAEPFLNQHGYSSLNITTDNNLNLFSTSSRNTQNDSNTIKSVPRRKINKHLARLFKTHSDPNIIHEFIQNQFKSFYDQRVIMIIRCYLKAWFDSPLEKKHEVLMNNISIIEYYKSDPYFQIQLLYAIEIFLSKNKNNENWSIQIISTFLQLFLDYNCIEKQTLFKWNSDGPFYNDIYYQETKRLAQPFIKQLETSD